jgi:(1->4)-alpha-D-glucan 1-alpha-D-glucosylmutase
LTTHDTKRSEDTRARITVLAEIPDEWEAALDELLQLAPLPDPAFGSLLWQAVLGAWPATPSPDLRERLHAYAEKAMREAGERTAWTDPDEAYEAAVHDAVDAAFDDDRVASVLEGLSRRIDAAATSNALAAKLVALAMPGVPDVYQGTELWDQSLVDPDNRRPVDYAHRAAVLDGAEDPAWLKLAVVLSTLGLRRERPELFSTYASISATGGAADHVLAFDRGGVVAVATRLPVGLEARGWGDTELRLPPGTWTDVLTGHVTDGRLESLLSSYPVAVLVRDA